MVQGLSLKLAFPQAVWIFSVYMAPEIFITEFTKAHHCTLSIITSV